MKLDRFWKGAFAVMTVALACGCSATPSPRAAGQCPTPSTTAGTTSLMSAEVAGPAPRVGKPQLGTEEEAGPRAEEPGELGEPKEPRRSEGSRRSGQFGATK